MVNSTIIAKINEVLARFFSKNEAFTLLPAKDFMSYFIEAGIFPKDEKGGLPIRRILRALDRIGQLHLIPYIVAQRKQKNTNWYFTANAVSVRPERDKAAKKEAAAKKKTYREDSDEAYVVDLCDEILGPKRIRRH